MSFLAPLYFLGALAVIGPILFHLIRRQPRGEVEFSSLMFLESTPPRLTRRSRLENWWLLLLRCAAILLLALAFARPFFSSTDSTLVDQNRRAVILVMDQSASMRRQGVWDDAISKAQNIIEAADPDTLISVVGFDQVPRNVLTLAESAQIGPESRSETARETLANLQPGWGATDLGAAIRFAADQAAIIDQQSPEESESEAIPALAQIETRIVVLSDLQSGASLESLQGYQWPDRVWADIQTAGPHGGANASLQVLPDTTGEGDASQARELFGDTVRVHVARGEEQASGGATGKALTLKFDGQNGPAATIQVPPGQSRIVNLDVPRQEAASESDLQPFCLRLYGDDDGFDNAFYFVRSKRNDQRVLFVRPDQSEADSPGSETPRREALSFYVQQVPWSDPTREVQLDIVGPAQWQNTLAAADVPLMMFARPPKGDQQTNALRRYVAAGGNVLLVLDQTPDEDQVASLATLLDSPNLTVQAASKEQSDDQPAEFHLIESVRFEDPLIAPLSDPGVNDFSNIRVWNHQVIRGLSDSVSTILRLDDGAPLMVATAVADAKSSGAGRVWVLTSGWQPAQSQFGLSTKFVPIMLGMLGRNRALVNRAFVVGETIDDQTVAEEPGFARGQDETLVAVNVDPRESETDPIDIDRFSQLGVRVSSLESQQQDKQAQRALRDVELESRQGWWQWLILGTIAFLAAETWLSARTSRQAEAA
ncbi:VWA domain-containing protein [Roseiconus nitratireducens]|uniref:VWA domain-containing protein n=1 Tax=Roseiconus nitratireducens TaxID=2605748 RepID=A0A5M6DHW8_9BACT|nr:BatA domain-containing protein [Roseiconus nitratireducens]KAA5545862.1 VWA domain-containing protein [Roseiconus nitratireducens]